MKNRIIKDVDLANKVEAIKNKMLKYKVDA